MKKILVLFICIFVFHFIIALFYSRSIVTSSDFYFSKSRWLNQNSKHVTNCYDETSHISYFSLMNNEFVRKNCRLPLFTGVVYSVSINARSKEMSSTKDRLMIFFGDKILTSVSITNNIWHPYNSYFTIAGKNDWSERSLKILACSGSSIDVSSFYVKKLSFVENYFRKKRIDKFYIRQIVKNGDFTQNLEGWDIWKGDDSLVKVINNNGNSSFVRFSNPQMNLVGIRQNINLTTGLVYRMSASSKVSPDNTNKYFASRVELQLPNSKNYVLRWQNANNNWIRKDLVFTNDISCKAILLVYVGFGKNFAPGDFKDIRIDESR
jgi:hypothetical protein